MLLVQRFVAATLVASSVVAVAACATRSPEDPPAVASQAAPVTAVLVSRSDTCETHGYSFACRIDSRIATDCTGGGISATLANMPNATIDWSATGPVDAVLVDSQFFPFSNLYEYSPGSTGDTGLSGPGQEVVGLIDFCIKTDAGVDAGEDGAPDAGQDAAQDAPAEAAPDAAHDGGPRTW